MLLLLVIPLLINLIILLTGIKSPVWFPSPGSWLKAFGLAIPAWSGFVAVLSLGFWYLVFLSLLAFASDPPAPLDALVIMPLLTAGVLVTSLLWYLLLIWLYSLFLRFLWSEVPHFLRWINPPKRKRNLLLGWGVSTLAVLIGSVPFSLPLFHLYSDYPITYNEVVLEAMRRQVIDRMFIGWYMSAAYLYHVTSVVQSKIGHSAKSSNRKSS